MAVLGQTATQSGLATMMGQMPTRNKLIADQQKAARALQLQQAIAAAPAPLTQAQASEAAGQVAQAAGQQQIGRAQQMMQTAEQAARLGGQETALAGREKIAGLQEAARTESLGQAERLAAIDQEAKKELFDTELQIQKDANNNALLSARQLADYAMLSANRQESFDNWKQKSLQYSERNLKMLQIMEQKLAQAVKDGYLDKRQKLDQAQKQELAQIQKDLQNRIAKANAKKNNINMMAQGLSTAMTVAGSALVLSGVGTPVGVGLMAAAPAVSAAGQQYATQEAQKEAR